MKFVVFSECLLVQIVVNVVVKSKQRLISSYHEESVELPNDSEFSIHVNSMPSYVHKKCLFLFVSWRWITIDFEQWLQHRNFSCVQEGPRSRSQEKEIREEEKTLMRETSINLKWIYPQNVCLWRWRETSRCKLEVMRTCKRWLRGNLSEASALFSAFEWKRNEV